MKRLAALLGLSMIAGCADPASSRLETGSVAKLFNASRDTVPATGDEGAILEIPAGTPVRVARDGDRSAEKYRDVSVSPTEGTLRGQLVRVPRAFLRPTD